MALKDGDFILLEYTVHVKETGNIVDTTNEEIARKEGIYDSNRLYGPELVVIGKGWVIKGLDEALKELEPGAEKEIIVPPEKAYGTRDPSKIKVFSIREFRRRGIDVKLGDVIEYGGQTGIVKSISGGRVVVDFNHPLAGKTLIYKVRVVRKLEDPVDKARALTARHLGLKMEEVDLEYNVEEKTLYIKIPTKIMTKKDIQYAKIALVSNIFEFLKEDVKKIVFQEIFERREEKAPEKREVKEEAVEAKDEEKQIGEQSVEAKNTNQ